MYQNSQTQRTIINAIKQGDNDLHQILDLVTMDPTKNWESATVQEQAAPSDVSYDGFELLEHNRIIDLRHWHPEEELPERRGLVYLRDRITLKKLLSYEGDGHLTFQVPVRAERLQFRQPRPERQCIITRISEPVDYHGQQRTLYEFDYDLSELPSHESATIEIEALLDYPESGSGSVRDACEDRDDLGLAPVSDGPPLPDLQPAQLSAGRERPPESDGSALRHQSSVRLTDRLVGCRTRRRSRVRVSLET